MNNIKALPPKNKKGHQDVISDLERYLEMAKNGEIEAVAIAAIYREPDNQTSCKHVIATGYDGHGFELYTSVSIMQDHMMKIMTE